MLGADDPEAVAGAQGEVGGIVYEDAVALEGHHMGLIVAAQVGGDEGFADERGAVGEVDGGEAEVGEVGLRLGGLLRGFDHRENGGDLVVGANHADGVAGEDAGVARGHHGERLPALDGDHIHPVSVADVGVGEAFAHEGASVAHVHVGQVEVGDHIVVFARTAQVALVEIVDKFSFDSAELARQLLGI